MVELNGCYSQRTQPTVLDPVRAIDMVVLPVLGSRHGVGGGIVGL